MISRLMQNSNLEHKHIMAIDFGKKYTGIATHKVKIDPIILAYGRIKYINDEELIKEIQHIIDEEFIDILVIGIPYFTDGTESKMTKEVRTFANKLKESINIPMYEQDETLSTYEAEERMKNDPKYNFQVDYSKIDSVAATIILEEFLNSKDI